MSESGGQHRAPWECTFAKEEKSKCRPGIRPKSDQQYFEILCLCVLQAGLGWGMVRKIWPKLRKGFYNFSIERLATTKMNELLQREGVIKNKNKVKAVIDGARKFQSTIQEAGSFSNFLISLKGRGDKEAIRKLTQRFSHVGEYTAQYYLHSIGYWE
ncbi:MAG: DNA-3-methyladenine glycosylase I [bacterium]